MDKNAYALSGPVRMIKTDQLRLSADGKAVEQVPESMRCDRYYCTYSGYCAPDQCSYELRYSVICLALFQRRLLHPDGRATTARR